MLFLDLYIIVDDITLNLYHHVVILSTPIRISNALYIEAHAPHSFQSVLKRIQLSKGCLCHLQFQRANRRHAPNSYTRFLNRFKMANPFILDAGYWLP